MEPVSLNLSNKSIEFFKDNFYWYEEHNLNECNDNWYLLTEWITHDIKDFTRYHQTRGYKDRKLCVIAQLNYTGIDYKVFPGILIRKFIEYEKDQAIYTDSFFALEDEDTGKVAKRRLEFARNNCSYKKPEIYIKTLKGIPKHVMDDLDLRIDDKYLLQLSDRDIPPLEADDGLEEYR